MTAEQAANHPSKNIISRALGAEDGVEVDMRVMEVEDGTQFLLCTDGITRHIPDYELRQLMILNEDLPTLCAALKERCYERGAEDNLTAVVVRVGTAISAAMRSADGRDADAGRRRCTGFIGSPGTLETAPAADLSPHRAKRFPTRRREVQNSAASNEQWRTPRSIPLVKVGEPVSSAA